MKFKLYTDGACSGNPGPGGYGSIIICDDQQVFEIGAHYSQATNNRMELQAVISGLDYIINHAGSNKEFSTQVYTDSVYVIRGITQWIFSWKKNGWKNSSGEPVTNQDLWIQLDTVVQKIPTKISWDYVRGHNDDPGNERCDQIAVAFSKNNFIQLFQGSSENYIFDVTAAAKSEPLPEARDWKKSPADKKNSWYLSLINGVITKYSTWSECEAQVKGRPAVKFKKVSSDQEEQDLLKSWGK